jgi:hypothetical protein
MQLRFGENRILSYAMTWGQLFPGNEMAHVWVWTARQGAVIVEAMRCLQPTRIIAMINLSV